jgi:CheY-like chemotaxis protein
MGFHTPYAVSRRLGRVLVVDDEPSFRKLVNLTLTKAGYEVVEAQDGEHAIQVLNSGDNPLKVDTILCDIRLVLADRVMAQCYKGTDDALELVVRCLEGSP